jgi:hypothetical protein
MGWSLVRWSSTKCRNKITKPPVWGGQGPYKDCRVTNDDDDDDDVNDRALKWRAIFEFRKLFWKRRWDRSSLLCATYCDPSCALSLFNLTEYWISGKNAILNTVNKLHTVRCAPLQACHTVSLTFEFFPPHGILCVYITANHHMHCFTLTNLKLFVLFTQTV